MIHNFPSRVQGSRCGGLPVSLEAILPAGEPKGVQHSVAVQRAHKLPACPTPLRSANRGSKPCTKTRKPKKPSAGCEPCSNAADLVSKTDTFILPLRNTTGCPRMRRQGVGRRRYRERSRAPSTATPSAKYHRPKTPRPSPQEDALRLTLYTLKF
jgi:hypothetical protein